MSRKRSSRSKEKQVIEDDDLEIMEVAKDSKQSTELIEDAEEEEVVEDGEEDDILEDEEVYIVEAILSHRLSKKKKIEYLVKWEGYPSSSNTWEPETSFPDKNTVLAEYKQKHGLLKDAKKSTKQQAPSTAKTTEKTQTSKKDAASSQPTQAAVAESPASVAKGKTREKADDMESEKADSSSNTEAAMVDTSKTSPKAATQKQSRAEDSDAMTVESDAKTEEYARYEQELIQATLRYRPPQEPGLWCARYNVENTQAGDVEWVDMSKQL